jgi:hypothetical protein
MSLLERLQELVEAEVQKQLMKYAQVISKKHDISLKLLLRDIPSASGIIDEPVPDGNRCLGVTAKGIQCTFTGKFCGYCKRHVSQKKERPKPVESPSEKSPHVGHTMKDCMFLAGCPACERLRGSRQNLLIDF